MIAGTTPTHTFKFPSQVSISEIAELRVTYEQGGNIVLQKHKKECTLGTDSVVVKLTQEESLRFASNVPVRIQLKVRTKGGDVLVSKMTRMQVHVVLDKEVI